MTHDLTHKVFAAAPGSFEEIALEVFRFQYAQNPLYARFTEALGIKPEEIKSLLQIPFLPIGFFKTHSVVSTAFSPEAVFESSGTTGSINSQHLVKDPAIYRQSFLEGFRLFYGDPSDWCIIGLLPSYLERKNSSLVYMVDELVRRSGHKQSGFYLNEYARLQQVLYQLEASRQKTLLVGVTFALLDFAADHPMQLQHTIVMETGGMKGRREEMTRQEVHAQLKAAFGLNEIHSEYGMTELLSQAYSEGNGIFTCPPWMKIMLREEDDPLEVKAVIRDPASGTRTGVAPAMSGIINVIDLANLYSCSFIATDDAGKLYFDGSFEVTGRIDNSDLRGCSLMVTDIKQ